MFSGPRSAPSAPAASGAGVGSLTTPDQNAQALRGLFRAPPSMAFPAPGMQPVQSFQTGGEALSPAEAARRQAIDDMDARGAPAAPTSQFYRDIAPFLPSMPTEGRVIENAGALRRLTEARQNAMQEQQRALEERRAGSPGSSVGDYFRPMSPEERAARSTARTEADKRLLREGQVIGQTFAKETGVASLLPAPPAPPSPPPAAPAISPEERARMLDADRNEESGSYRSRPAPAPAPPPAAPAPASAPSVSTSLEEIRSRREAREAALTAAERRENGLLALMQAGFATAAGTSPNALSNIGAGGQAGIAAFANLEKSRREDAAARRREQLSREISTAQLQKEPDQIRTLAMMGGWTPDQGREGLQAAVAKGMQIQRSMQPEPEAVRTYAFLGGWTPSKGQDGFQEAVVKGFQFTQSKDAVQRAAELLKLSQLDPTLLTAEQKKAFTDLVAGNVSASLGRMSTGGGAAFPDFSATRVR